tara:strand:+ start:9849 stop:10592 length:744 start_codon:yes stop_codon:yes gene_type:complete
LKNDTQRVQSELAEYVRSGILTDITGARPERLPHYRRLVFNVIFDTLSSAFPIARKVVSNSWKGLVARFFSSHSCQNYQVWRMPREFMNYVLEHEKQVQLEIPFLADLLLFEWIEIELYSEPDIEIADTPHNGNFENGTAVLNPHRRALKLSYPVFTNQYDDMVDLKGVYYLAVFRNLDELKVRYIQLSPLFGEALMNINDYGGQLSGALYDQSKKLTDISKSELVDKSIPIVDELIQRNLILGFRK